MKKTEGKKSLKWLLIALIALVVVAAVGVTLWLILGNKEQTAPEGMKIYWNVERDQYVAKGDKGRSARYARDDGYFYIRFAVDGEQVDLPVDGIDLVNKIDNMEYMGLELNEAGVVIGAYHIEDFTGGLAADHYYVEAVNGTTVTVNTAGTLKGVSVDIEIPQGTPMYNVSDAGVLCGTPVQELHRDDEVIAIKDTSGKVFMVYVMPYIPAGPIYWNINRMYDSTTGRTTRTSDALGYYSFDFAYGGEVVTLRTRDPNVANQIDAQAAKCMGLEFDEEGLIIAYQSTRTQTRGGVIASWYNTIEVNGNEVQAKRTIGGSEQGNVVTCRLTEHSKVVLTTTGEYTEPMVGDQIHCLTDSRGNVAYMFVISRLNEDAHIGWNVERKWKSPTSTRTPDSQGYYHVTIAANGEQLKLKSKDLALMTAIDRNAAKCFAFTYEGDMLTSVSGTGVKTGGGVAMSWYHVDEVDENGNVTATKRTDTKSAEYGQTVTKKMAADCKIYNVSTNAELVGMPAQLQVNDQIHGLTNMNGDLLYIFIVNRPVDKPIFWNVNRMYNTTTKQTTRVPEADGFYHFEMCGLGKTWDLKVRTKEMATQIDSNAAKCWGLSVWNGEVTQVLGASSTIKGAGGVQVSWCNITRVTKYSAQAIKHGNGTEDGNTYVIDYAYGCKFYDVSNEFKEVCGEETTLRVGDLVHCLRNAEGKTTIVWIISRGPENGFTDYCNMCKKDVLWSAWDGTTGMGGETHYFLESDVHIDEQVVISGAKISLFLNGYTLSSDSRVFRLNSGTKLNIYDSMTDGSDIGGKIVGRGLDAEAAKAEGGSSEGGVIILWGSNTLNLHSGTLQLAEDHNSVASGGVVAGNGIFNMYGGKLTGGVAKNSGGTMRRYGGSTQTNIYGGIIENGTAGTSGGHISMGGAGNKLNIQGGTFIGGTAKSAGQDVWHEKNTSVTLGGKVNLDIHINTTATVNALEEGSSITVTCGDPDEPFAILKNPEDAKYFHSGDEFMDILAEGNKLYLKSNLTNQVHCVCGGHAKGVGDHTTCSNIEWTPWTSKTSLPTTSGNYYLMVDVNASGYTMTGGDDIKLCLNGHNVNLSSLIWLKGNFTVTDCVGSGTIYSTRAGHSNVFYTYELSHLKLYSGTISGEKASAQDYSVISICDDDWDGDGVRERSYFTMYGGKIIGRDADTKDGAGVYMMRNGEFTMYGGTITGGKTSKAGAAVFLGTSTCKVNLLGGTITGNSSGSGAVFTSTSMLTVGGDMKITGNTKLDGSTPNNLRVHGGNLVDMTGLGSNAKIGINLNAPSVFAENVSDFTKQVESDDAAYKVSYADGKLSLESKTPPHKHCLCNGNAKGVGDHTTCSDIEWQPWTSTTSLPTTTGNYYLTGNVKLTTGVRISNCTINICLNGYNITSESRVYRMGANSNLTFTDHKSGSVYKGTVTGIGLKQDEIAGDSNGNATEGGVFMQYNNTTDLRIYGGNFTYVKPTDGRTPVRNGGILQGGGTFKLYDGVLTGDDVTLNGCVLRSWGEKTRWYLYGGTLIGAKAANTGGVVSINAGKAGAELYIGSVTVKGGSAAKAGGIFVDSYCSKITLAGNPQITANSNSNLFLSSGKILTLDSSLQTTARVGISMQTLGKFATARTSADKQIFSSDSRYSIYLDGLDLHMNSSSAVPHKHCVCADNYSGTGHSHSELSWTAWDGTGTLTSGNYYLTANVKRGSITVNSGDTVRICLNGYTIDTQNDRALRIFGNLTITDCSENQTGTVTNTRTALAPVFYVQNAATFNLYGGTLKAAGKTTQAGVGAVSDEDANGAHAAPGTMSIYGGTVTGGYSSSGDGGLISMWNKTTLNIYGGKLTNGYCAKNGGLVCVGNGCTLNIYGGEFSKGTAGNVGDAISLGATAKLTLSGKPVFTGNDGEDIWDMGSSNITVKDLDSSVRIKINATDERTLAANVTTNVSACFQSANDAFQVVWENASLVFKAK